MELRTILDDLEDQYKSFSSLGPELPDQLIEETWLGYPACSPKHVHPLRAQCACYRPACGHARQSLPDHRHVLRTHTRCGVNPYRGVVHILDLGKAMAQPTTV